MPAPKNVGYFGMFYQSCKFLMIRCNWKE